jgi:hypothetical protein
MKLLKNQWIEKEDAELQVPIYVSCHVAKCKRLVKISGEGRMRGQPVEIKGRVGSLNAFYQGKTAYPV